METEAPRPARGLLVRLFWTLIGLLLLAVLGTGPVMYVAYRYPHYYRRLIEPWDGFRAVIRATPLDQPVERYWDWWRQLGLSHMSEPTPLERKDGEARRRAALAPPAPPPGSRPPLE